MSTWGSVVGHIDNIDMFLRYFFNLGVWCFVWKICLEFIWSSDFQPFSSLCTHDLITKILQCTKKYIFANLTKNYRYNFYSFTPDGCCPFLFDSLREKRSVPLAEESGIAWFQNSCGVLVENRRSGVTNNCYLAIL